MPLGAVWPTLGTDGFNSAALLLLRVASCTQGHHHRDSKHRRLRKRAAVGPPEFCPQLCPTLCTEEWIQHHLIERDLI